MEKYTIEEFVKMFNDCNFNPLWKEHRLDYDPEYLDRAIIVKKGSKDISDNEFDNN